jgi:hypothetical protein
MPKIPFAFVVLMTVTGLTVTPAAFDDDVSRPEPLNTNAAADSGNDEYPHVMTDKMGNWIAVWYSHNDLAGTIGIDPDILIARSTDNGVTWTDPVPLNTNAGTDDRFDFLPKVTTDGAGNWVAAWRLATTTDEDADILIARSTDNGVTWTDPEPLNTNAATDTGDDLHQDIVTDNAGNWVAVWYSDDQLDGTIGTDQDILVARSTNNGVTWTDPEPLNTNAGTDSGSDWTPVVTTNDAGNWVVVWASTDDFGGTMGEDRDILVARSTDNGVTWTDPEPLNTNAATDTGDDVRPRVATDGAGHWIAVWDSWDALGDTIGTDQDILIARSTDNGVNWTDPVPVNTNAGTDSGVDRDPRLTTDSAGNWLLTWWSDDDLAGTIGTDSDILVVQSTDNGITWTDPEPLNTNAGTDSGNDRWQHVTTDDAGNWVAVWNSFDDLRGTIGDDSDILTAHWPAEQHCPLERVFSDATRFGQRPPAAAEADLDAVRLFRDDVLSRSATGRELGRMYYRHGPEIREIMRDDPYLFFQTSAVFFKALPAIRRAAAGDGAIVLRQNIIAEMEQLAEQYETVASPEFADAIERARTVVLGITQDVDGARLRIEFTDDDAPRSAGRDDSTRPTAGTGHQVRPARRRR